MTGITSLIFLTTVIIHCQFDSSSQFIKVQWYCIQKHAEAYMYIVCLQVCLENFGYRSSKLRVLIMYPSFEFAINVW